MSDFFGENVDSESDLRHLEDNEDIEISTNSEDYVYNFPLYRLKLEYSCEGIYANIEDESIKIEPGDYVIVPTRYGKDLARVLEM